MTDKCASLTRAVWFTLESSKRSTSLENDGSTNDDDDEYDIEKKIAAVGSRMDAMSSMGLPMCVQEKWADRATTWKESSWINFCRLIKPMAGMAFEPLSKEERKLYESFLNYWAFYACAQQNPSVIPEGTPDNFTIDDAVKKVEDQLDVFKKRIGDPLIPCGRCSKIAIGKKMSRCSRCKQIYYCSIDCQKKHYKHHKKVCREKLPS